MKALLTALPALLSLLGLAIANEAAAPPSPASTSIRVLRIPDSPPPAVHLRDLNSTPRVGFAAAVLDTSGTLGTTGNR